MSDITWTNCKVRLGDLRKWEGNPAEISKAAAGRLVESFNEFGQAHVILIEPDYQILDGHQRDDVWGAKFGDDFMVDCRMASRKFTDEERRKFVIYLRSGTTGSYDWDTLSGWDAKELIEWGLDDTTLRDWKRDVTALDNLLESEKQEPVDAEPQIDRADELNEKWQVKTGDLWQIGEHRLLCGDSTIKADVDRVVQGELCTLCVTDPPYGVSYADKNPFLNVIAPGNHIQTPIENDHNGAEITSEKLWYPAFINAYEVSKAGAVIYCFAPQGGDQMMMMMMIMASWNKTMHQLIWLKNNHVLGRVDYAYKHEPIIYSWKAGGHKFYGDFQTSVLEFDKPTVSDLHPTMKPVALVEKLISNSSIIDEIVYEPFAGSGTTMVACENLHRKCRAIEISPNYCAVILERMHTAFPELEIKRITEQ